MAVMREWDLGRYISALKEMLRDKIYIFESCYSMITLDSILRKSNNNFDLIRLTASLMVIFGHSFELFDDSIYHDPIKAILITDSPGNLAVCIFFFLSGIFITSSFVTKKNHFSFVIRRVSRIWPGLIICTLITVFPIGVFLTSLTIKEYFTNRETWLFLINNLFLFNITSRHLPGVFSTNHYPQGVNGSLWTLPLEVKCYCIVFFGGLLGLFTKRIYMLCIFMIILLLVLTNHGQFLSFVGLNATLFFLAGSVCYMYKQFIFIDKRIGLAMIVVCFFIYSTPIFMPFFYVTLIYIMLVLGASKTLIKIKLPGDYSYGIYIYGFVLQQVIAHFLPNISPYKSLIFTLPIIILMAILSWHFIENPSIKAGKKVDTKFN
jgi:peptidoglycan/LPS O-acetylase OafA/YrhL